VLFTDKPNVAVALVYQSQALHQHLRAALDEFGANIVYEATTSGFNQAALDGSGASVVLINLDPAIDEEIAQIEHLLIDDTRKVIFNDGEVTSKLSGWDLARWARHLAAKIMGDTQLLPARPLGAEAVPVRDMPQHALDSAFKPAALQPPVVSGEAEAQASREINAALASFSVGAGASETHAQARDELEAALNDFGFFSEPAAAKPVNDLPVAKPDPVPAAAAPKQVANLAVEDSPDSLFADFDFSGAPEGTTAADVEVIETSDDSAFSDIQFDFDAESSPSVRSDVPQGLDAFLEQHSFKQQEVTVELPVPKAVAATTRKPAVDVDNLLSNLSFELSPIEEAPRADAAANASAAPATAPASSQANELSSDFDDILSSLSLQPMEDAAPVFATADSAAPAEAKPRAAAPAPDPFAGLSLELEPVEPAAEAADDNPFASLDFSSLEDAEPAAPAAAKPAAPIARNVAATTARNAPALTGSFSRVWVLGASIGGPDAVREFLSGIPKSTSNVFLLAQHMGADFIDLMVSQLAKATPLEVKMAAAGSAAQAGQVLVVPLAERLLLGVDGDVRIVPLDEASPYSPSIDQVLFDVADRFGTRAGAIIFSGMAHDAIEGARHLAEKGGTVWVQDPATCVVSSMIDGAIEAGIVRYQGSPAALAQKFSAEFA
jgi:chemosensory pili system protein ChpB (putative protein-glutamate methylesterase)